MSLQSHNLSMRTEDGVGVYMIEPDADARAMEMLLEVRRRGRLLIEKLGDMVIQDDPILMDFPRGSDRPITKAVKRLLAQYGERGEGLTVREFYTDDKSSTVVAENVSKNKINICLRDRHDSNTINDVNTTFRVLMHEFAPTMDEQYVSARDHGAVFYRYQDFLFFISKSILVKYKGSQVPAYECKSGSVPFCGLQLTARGCPNKTQDAPNTKMDDLPEVG